MERGLTFACQTAAAKAEVVHYRPCCCVGDRLRLHQSQRQGVGEMKMMERGGRGVRRVRRVRIFSVRRGRGEVFFFHNIFDSLFYSLALFFWFEWNAVISACCFLMIYFASKITCYPMHGYAQRYIILLFFSFFFSPLSSLSPHERIKPTSSHATIR